MFCCVLHLPLLVFSPAAFNDPVIGFKMINCGDAHSPSSNHGQVKGVMMIRF